MGDLTKDFSHWESACRCGCGFDDVDMRFAGALQAFRDLLGRRLDVSSWCRCPIHNAAVGGSQFSEHPRGDAADVSSPGMPARTLWSLACGVEPWNTGGGMGVYPEDEFIHLDTRVIRARWGLWQGKTVALEKALAEYDAWQQARESAHGFADGRGT